MSRAIDALRNADNSQKPVQLGALRSVPCSVTDVCAVQSLCVAAYEGHVRALDLILQVKTTYAAAPANIVSAKLAEAEAALARAKASTDACTTKQGEIIRRFRVGR